MKRKLRGGLALALIAAMTLLAAAGCGGDTSGPPAVSGEKAIYYGDDTGEVLHNPLMGWSYYAFPWEIIRYGIPDEFDVGYILCSWDQLEPEQGRYDFDLLTRAIKRLRQDGKTVYLRLYLMPDNVWDIAGYPAWVRDVPGVGEFKDVEIDVLTGKYAFAHPDYSNKVYQGLVSKFLKRVSKEYEDGFFDLVDLRAYGLYGEWDSDWGNYWDKTDPNYKEDKRRALNDFVALYRNAFSGYERTMVAINVPSISFSTEEERREYLSEGAYDAAMEAGFAIRYDAVANTYPANLFMRFLQKEYPVRPVFGETVYGWDLTRLNVEATYANFCAVGANIATFGFFKGNYEEAIAYNETFFTDTLKPNADGDVIGYRILPERIEYNREANTGGKIHFSSVWKNLGAGVLFRKYALGLSLTNASGEEVYFAVRDEFDLTGLRKGGAYEYETEFNLPDAGVLPAGEYSLRICLADAWNNYKSTVELPIAGRAADSADYTIGRIVIR